MKSYKKSYSPWQKEKHKWIECYFYPKLYLYNNFRMYKKEPHGTKHIKKGQKGWENSHVKYDLHRITNMVFYASQPSRIETFFEGNQERKKPIHAFRWGVSHSHIWIIAITINRGNKATHNLEMCTGLTPHSPKPSGTTTSSKVLGVPIQECPWCSCCWGSQSKKFRTILKLEWMEKMQYKLDASHWLS